MSRCAAKTTIPTVECKVIGHIDWNGFIADFMKAIHIIEIKPEGLGSYIEFFTFSLIVVSVCSFGMSLNFKSLKRGALAPDFLPLGATI